MPSLFSEVIDSKRTRIFGRSGDRVTPLAQEAFWLQMREDVMAWSTAMLPPDQQPTPVQERILLAVQNGERVACVGARGCGKTRTLAILALWFLTTRPSLVFLVTPTWALTENTMREIRALWAMSELPKLFPTWITMNTSVTTDDAKWVLEAVASKEESNLEGRHAPTPGECLLLIDEAKTVSDAL